MNKNCLIAITGHFISLIFVFLFLSFSALAAAEPAISIMPQPLDRGTAGQVTVTGLSDNKQLSGTFDGRPIFFFPSGQQMIGLFGADVMLSPGYYPLTVTWKGGRKEVDVQVSDRQYGVRSIKVPKNQVELSKADQERAAREKEAVMAVLDLKSLERLWATPWVVPVGGKVNSSFGRQTKINGVLNPRPHAGADFLVGQGTAVKAPADGVVALADDHFFAGKSVYIDHGQGLISMYFHLSRIDVKAGENITQGQVLGLSGKTGRVTGAHLHYGVYLNQARIDPVAFQQLTEQLPKE